MSRMRYLHFCAHEQFPPEQLLRQAVAAEAAGFDGIGCSDHLQPWWEPGEAGHAWVWLGAAAQATERALVGTGELKVETAQAFPRARSRTPGSARAPIASW